MTTPTVLDAVHDLVAAWLPTQRWFGGKGRDFEVEVARLAELLASPQVTLWTAQVHYTDGGDVETYQVPLVSRFEPADNLEHVLLGTVQTEVGMRWVYDALHDKDVTPAWLAGIRDADPDAAADVVSEPDAGSDVAAGTPDTELVRFSRYVSPTDIPVDEPSLVLSGEQSNTSMIFGDTAIMKVFRRLQPGVNPDIEVQGELSRLGATNIARLLGSIEADVDGHATSLAFLQEYLSSATDGWVLATSSVRDLMAEGDLHADEAGGDFAGEAERLGTAVASVHHDLAEAFGQRTATADELAEKAVAMRERLERASAIVPQLSEVADGLLALFAAVGELSGGQPLQRIHGDLHLGQALRTVYRWVLIDFEGEPMAEIGARRELDSPLRDVAGMLRSFDYAGHHRIADTGNAPQLAYRANEWAQRNREAFCRGYAEAAGVDLTQHAVLLRAYEADKAVYEAVYEARNRPTWLAIPLASLAAAAKHADDPES